MASASQPSAVERPRNPIATILLLAWVVIACALFLLASPPPSAPVEPPEAPAIRQRTAEWAERDAEDWQREEGDLTIPWDQAEGHLAIVVDDVGRELDYFDKLLALRFPLSFSILPGAVYAQGVADRLDADPRRPREILLHLPMEPLDATHMQSGDDAREDFLRAADDPKTLQAKLEAALVVVPDAVGVNNHMGSRLTTDARAMAALMPTLRARGLYFFDSRTHPETVAATEAERAGVATISRKFFLDHEPGKPAIRRALAQAAESSRHEPTVVIAHPSMDVVEVLRDELPQLHRGGVGIYPLSRLIAASR
ncbi:divergent polysaccharide deacetylase family protein [Pseudenhygromyxa sp. WMMC2535]|uniref:divergent polysaccharide deacetylase family protein n=1 Tax=Pseudenhygromyxa sp. WMMC2535 TaxID=2712867 RepID=UPI0015546A0F|nr:divergent polysaccharide deacetylase family protein [Pseudenhygromyxa sp. WMMC2535]NVB38842.1 divergent polysaccharide deacetylase family protein [Pseudenhygromyxa sp. WMMC2535]